MQVLAHLDPVVLEQTLLDELAGLRPEGLSANGLVVVPTHRLATHVERRMLDRRAAWLGVDVLHFRALAHAILAEAGAPVPRVLSANLREALLRGVLRRHDGNRWSAYVRRRPGALGALGAAMTDLRESGLTPQDLIDRGGDDSADLADLYAGLCDELARLHALGWVDEPGLIEAALPHAEAFAKRRNALWVHGAYEWIGVHLRLIAALDRGREVRLLLPFAADAPAAGYAGRFLENHVRDGAGRPVPARPIEAEAEGRLPLVALYDEPARPKPGEGPGITYRSAQGAAAEIKGAVRAALAAVGDGCPPSEIVIAARTLTPYEAALDEVLEQEGLPWTGSLTQPLRNHPAIHDFALLVAILDEGFPRRGTAELLRSPRIRWERFAGDDGPARVESADGWSRAAGVVGGLEEWKQLLVEWAAQIHGRAERSAEEQERAEMRAAERTAEARRIGDTLQQLHDGVDAATARPWSEHAARLAALIDDTFDTKDEVWNDLTALLDEMRSLETIGGETGAVRFADMRRWLDAAIDRTERALHRRDNGGIRVLDMMQLRGITCRRLFLVGMNSGVLPRPPRPDAVLSDELREALGRTETPLSVKKNGLEEEKLLLAIALGSATESIELTWQRADEAGRGRTPSLALRETTRLSHGMPDLAVCLRDAAWHPSHPTLALEWLQRTAGMLSAREERLLTSLHSVGQPAELNDWYPELTPGLNLLRATESFDFVDPAFDGRVGSADPSSRPLSVSALEMLAKCPLRFFFQRVLRVREFDEEAAPFELTPRERGQCVHDLLETTYSKLRAEGLFERPLADRIARATEILEENWEHAWHALARRLGRRAPALWSSLETRWRGALERFVADDLERIETNEWGVPETERGVDQEITFGDDRVLHLVGRVDRAFRAGDRAVIGDYKTGRVEGLTNETRMLKAETLQVPLYWMLADAKARVEIIGVGPSHDPADIDTEDRVFGFSGMTTAQFEGFLETMRVLTDLIGEGTFPLKDDNIGCGYCPYELACRHRHPPTLEREEYAKDQADFADLQKKNKTKKTTLAAVRGET